jgi:hypothetical protein
MGASPLKKPLNIRAAALLLAFAGCSPLHPEVTLAPGVSLKDYHLVVVAPVKDGTDYAFPFDITDSLRQRLSAELESQGLAVAKGPADSTARALVIAATLERFRSGALALKLPTTMGTSRCAMSADLTDARTGRHLGHIVASELTGEGMGALAPTPFALLMTCARMVADGLAQRVKGG